MKVKVWNAGWDWQNQKNEKGEPAFKAPPKEKAGSLIIEYPLPGEFVEVELSPPNAASLSSEKRRQIEHANRKRLDRAIEFSKIKAFPNGRLTLVEPGTEPAARADNLEEENRKLKEELEALKKEAAPKGRRVTKKEEDD